MDRPSRGVMQPNAPTGEPMTGFGMRFWGVVILAGTGTGTGLGAGGPMLLLLPAVQHLTYEYRSGPSERGMSQTSAEHRMTVVVADGVLLGHDEGHHGQTAA